MREILIWILIGSIICLAFEGVVVFKNLKTRLHMYLFFNCVVMIVNTTGYLLSVLSDSQDEYITALKFSYLGRIWITFSLFMFSAELCHIKLSKYIPLAIVFFSGFTYVTIFTLEYHTLYYKDIVFSNDKILPILYHGNGWVHDLYMQVQVVMIIFVFYWLFKTLHNQNNKTAKKRILIILPGFVIAASSFIIHISHSLKITEYFDVFQYGNIAVTITMFIAIFRYNLLGVIDVAREYIIDRISEGVIAVDDRGVVQYYNDHAKMLYPNLENNSEVALEEVKEAISRGDTIFFDDKYYTPEVKELKDNGEILGKLYVLVDSTALKQKEYKLKSEAAILERAAAGMRDRLLATEELIQQDRAMRHDRRHFEALLLSLIQDGKADDARKCLEERMNCEPKVSSRYCDNTTVNAALTHYVNVAEKKDINIKVATHIPNEVGVDEMKLAIAISNLIENAIHACEKQVDGIKYIEISSKYKNQLLFEITNSCDKKVVLDDDGHPFSLEAGHGIGTRSILSFIEETDSDIRYIAEDNKFTVRMIIG